eukprot:COSAG02_NODE_1216_length_13843_cov_500.465949_9_plen_71_part_00
MKSIYSKLPNDVIMKITKIHTVVRRTPRSHFRRPKIPSVVEGARWMMAKELSEDRLWLQNGGQEEGAREK